jgi:hypothetical protein
VRIIRNSKIQNEESLIVGAGGPYTGWSKSHATHTKLFVDGCNLIQSDWINNHTMSLWLCKSPRRSRHIVTCSRRQLSSISRSARMSFSQVQRVFIVEHYLASRSYLTCQNEFRDTFHDSPVPNKSTISRLVNRFRDTGSVQDRNRPGRHSVWNDNTERGGHFKHLT